MNKAGFDSFTEILRLKKEGKMPTNIIDLIRTSLVLLIQLLKYFVGKRISHFMNEDEGHLFVYLTHPILNIVSA